MTMLRTLWGLAGRVGPPPRRSVMWAVQWLFSAWIMGVIFVYALVSGTWFLAVTILAIPPLIASAVHSTLLVVRRQDPTPETMGRFGRWLYRDTLGGDD
jgi:hypothetical protein